MTRTPNTRWVQFFRQCRPVSRNDNMYDETIQLPHLGRVFWDCRFPFSSRPPEKPVNKHEF
jgi:hypothetical protein